jgi:Fic family protein
MNLTYLEIDHAREAYDALTGTARSEFRDRLRLCWLYHEHALDGVALSRDDIDRALADKPPRNYVDAQTKASVRRLDSAIRAIRDEAEARSEVTAEWLRRLHVHLCADGDEAAGAYRDRDTSPGVYNLDVVDADQVPERLEAFVDRWEDEWDHQHPVRAAALTHWEFMHIFPFDERTGMVGRLLLNFLLLREDYPPATFHAMRRHDYFQALRANRPEMVPVVVDAVRATIDAAESVDADDGPAVFDGVS